MKSVFVCHAPEDLLAALDLCKFLEMGVCCEVQAGALPAGETVATWYDHGGADAVVLMLSPRSVPPQWSVEEWQNVLDELHANRLASVVVAPCRKPLRLERRNYFDAGNRRGVKQWLLNLFYSSGERVPLLPSPHPSYLRDEAEMNVLRCAVGDRPGCARLTGSGATLAAIDFAHHFASDFERVVWSHCGDGTPEGAASDLALRLGLRLDGPLAADIEALEAYLSPRRYLVVLDSPPAGLLLHTGKSSLVIAGGSPGTYHYEHSFVLGQSEPPQSPAYDTLSRLPAGASPELVAAVSGAAPSDCEELYRNGFVLKTSSDRYWCPRRCPDSMTLSDAAAIMRYLVKRRDPEELGNAEAALRRALRQPTSDEAWETAKRLQSVACSIAKEHGRAVEAHAMVVLLEPHARARGDMRTQEECLRERSWFPWDQRDSPLPVEDLSVRQLELWL
jgi:hypothetical protein